MFAGIKNYFQRIKDMPPREKYSEYVLIALEVLILVFFIFEVLGVIPLTIGNYIIVPLILVYALINAIKCFKKSVLLSIMLIFCIIFILIYWVTKGFNL